MIILSIFTPHTQVCCAALAAAEAEANPQLYYNSFGHQQGHFNTYGYPTAMSSYSSYSAFPGYSAYPAYPAYPVHMAKREAEAEPKAESEAEAEPQMFLTSYGSQGLFNTAFNSYPTVYSGYPRSFYQPSYNNFGHKTFYGKREADAEPEAEADPMIREIYQTPYNTAFNTAFNTAYPTDYPFRTVYSGYRNFIQPASQYYGGYNY